jgi:lipoate-protein ligase A
LNSWRLILSGFNDAATNMAIDEALFLNYLKYKGLPTLRIYGWKPAAYSLGYFQDAAKELNINACKRTDINIVRRMTGGGIIFHDQELTYSLVCSKADLETNNIKHSFKILCSFLIKAYKKLGLEAGFADEMGLAKADSREFASFCFASNEDCDILIKGKKIGGNAQRRRRDVIFQHGSIPLKLDIHNSLSMLTNPDYNSVNRFCSLESLLKKPLTFYELEHILIESFKEVFKGNLTLSSLSETEKALTLSLKADKYNNLDWNIKSQGKDLEENESYFDNQETCLAEQEDKS